MIVESCANRSFFWFSFSRSIASRTILMHWPWPRHMPDRKSTRLNSSHLVISYAVFCLKKKTPVNSSHLVISYAVFCLKKKRRSLKRCHHSVSLPQHSSRPHVECTRVERPPSDLTAPVT